MKVEDVEIERRLEKFKSTVKKAGIKLTHQRLEIFREVAASIGHPSAEAVLKAVQPRMPTVSLDTVYRTLWLLTDLGLVNTLGPRRESVRFDANLEHHHHYVCVRCGLVRDFNSSKLDELPIPNAVTKFGRIVTAHIEVLGVCDRCTKEEGEASVPKKANKPQAKGGKKTWRGKRS